MLPSPQRSGLFLHIARGTRLAALVLAATVTSVSAHDLFFRASSYFISPRAEMRVDVLSGTFSRSENAITRDRLTDLSLVSPAGRVTLDRERWTQQEPKSTVTIRAEAPGTYVLGAAIAPRMLALSGPRFNAYLKEEGLDDVLAGRAAQKRLGEPSRERYSKYLKALLQVGEATSDGWATELGYGAEIVPDRNPYRLQPGDVLTVRCLVEGRPWAEKVVFAGGRRGSSDERVPQQRLITDAAGRATVKLTDAGIWFIKFVAMQDVAAADANYESRWSTLTFAVGTHPLPVGERR